MGNINTGEKGNKPGKSPSKPKNFIINLNRKSSAREIRENKKHCKKNDAKRTGPDESELDKASSSDKAAAGVASSSECDKHSIDTVCKTVECDGSNSGRPHEQWRGPDTELEVTGPTCGERSTTRLSSPEDPTAPTLLTQFDHNVQSHYTDTSIHTSDANKQTPTNDSSDDSVFADPLTPLAFATEINQSYYSAESDSTLSDVSKTLQCPPENVGVNMSVDSANNTCDDQSLLHGVLDELNVIMPENSFSSHNMNSVCLSPESEKKEKYFDDSSDIDSSTQNGDEVMGTSKSKRKQHTQNDNYSQNYNYDFKVNRLKASSKQTNFTLSRYKKVELPPTTMMREPLQMDSDSSVADENTARHLSLNDESVIESNVLRKVASLTLDRASTAESKITRPAFVPEKLDFQLYEKFEGQMLVNWFASAVPENSHMRNSISYQDLKILGIQYCNNLLAAGVLRQIPDKDAPPESFFRTDLMYYWAHLEAPPMQPLSPGRMSISKWPPESTEVKSSSEHDRKTIMNTTFIDDLPTNPVDAKRYINQLQNQIEQLQILYNQLLKRFDLLQLELERKKVTEQIENLNKNVEDILYDSNLDNNNKIEPNMPPYETVINTPENLSKPKDAIQNNINIELRQLDYNKSKKQPEIRTLETMSCNRSDELNCKLNRNKEQISCKVSTDEVSEESLKLKPDDQNGGPISMIVQHKVQEWMSNVKTTSIEISPTKLYKTELPSDKIQLPIDNTAVPSLKTDESNKVLTEFRSIDASKLKVLPKGRKSDTSDTLVTPELPGMCELLNNSLPTVPPPTKIVKLSTECNSSPKATFEQSCDSLLTDFSSPSAATLTDPASFQLVASPTKPPTPCVGQASSPKSDISSAFFPSPAPQMPSLGLTPPPSMPSMAPAPPPMPGMCSPSPSSPGMGPPPPPMPETGPPSPLMPVMGPPPPPMPGMGPPPPPMPGMGPPPPPMPGMGPPPPPMPGMGPPPTPFPGTGPPPPPMPGMGPPPPPFPGTGPPPPPMPGMGPPPPPMPGSGLLPAAPCVNGLSANGAGPPPPPSAPVPFPAPPAGGWYPQKASLRKAPVKPEVPMKPLYWTRILAPATTQPTPEPEPKADVKPLWMEIEEETLENINEFMNLFSRKVVTKKPVQKKVVGKTKQQPIKILDSKRSQNVGILAQSLHVEFSEIENAIYNFDTSVVSLEAMQQIYELRATEEELAMIKDHLSQKSDVPLDKPETFLYDLSGIPNFAERISCFMFQAEFEDSISTIMHKLDNLKHTCEFLMTAKPLKKVLAITLTLGNYMNGGNNQRGQADGFGLEILSKLKDVKSTECNVTLLHFIVRTYCARSGGVLAPACVLPVPEPGEVARAQALDFADVADALAHLARQLQGCKMKMKKVIESEENNGSNNEDSPEEGRSKRTEVFKKKMTDFVDKAEEKLKTENENLEECKAKFKATMKFYQYSPKTGKLDDCKPEEFFSLWTTFCSDFKDIYKKEEQLAIKEKLKETKKQKEERVGKVQPKKEGGLKSRLQKLAGKK